MKVSVLMSVYNAGHTIATAVQSILDQSFPEFEFVIVDDGSTDDTNSIIRDFDDPRIRVFNQPHKGLVPALNYGLSQCRGHYIARMDADDFAFRERLALQSTFLGENVDIAAVSGQIEYGGDRTQNLGYALHVDWLNSLHTPEDIFLYRFQDSPVANPATMLRSRLFKKYGDYRDNGLPEDYEFWLRILHMGERIQPLQKKVLKWNDSPTRLTRTSETYSSARFFETKALYLQKWLDHTKRLDHDVLIFGKGRTVHKRVESLRKHGIKPIAFIDIRESSEPHILYYKHLEKRNNQLILSYVSDRKGKLQIEKFLNEKGFRLGTDYWLMA